MECAILLGYSLCTQSSARRAKRAAAETSKVWFGCACKGINANKNSVIAKLKRVTSRQGPGPGTCATSLVRQPQGKLDLPRVVDGPGCAVVRVGRSFQEFLRGRAALGSGIEIAEVGGAVHRVEEPDIHGVEKIEGLGHRFHVQFFCGLEGTGNARVDRLVAIALEGVARLNAYAIVVAEDVAVRVKAGKLGEVVGRLQRDNRAELEVVDENVHVRRPGEGRVQDKALAYAVRGKRALGFQVGAVLRNQNKAGIRSVIYSLGPGVAHAGGEVMAHSLVEVHEQPVPL